MKTREPKSTQQPRPPRAARAARKIRWCIAVDQAKAGAAAREAYLRSLMGLASTSARGIDKERDQ